MGEALYDESLLTDLEVSLPDGLRIRPLRSDDIENGKLILIFQLCMIL